MFFFVSYTIRKWPKFRKKIRNFSMQIPLYFEKFCDLLYQFFLTIQHRRHFLHTAEKLQDSDWGWGRYDNTSFNPYPFTAASRVFTTFRILEISYISNVFFVSSKIYFSDPDSNFNFFCFYTVLIFNTVQNFKDICYKLNFLFENIRNFVWKSCQIIRNVV
jgi:hypothetical protein